VHAAAIALKRVEARVGAAQSGAPRGEGSPCPTSLAATNKCLAGS